MTEKLIETENLEISVGVDDEHRGVKLGIDGEPFWRVWLTPQGDVLVGDGTTPPDPLTGGGGGNVATDNIWGAVGDLVVATGDNTAVRLAIGANGTVLKSNGTTAAWAALGALSLLNEVTVGEIDATGTPSGTTFLRGDGAWATPPGGSGDVASDAIWDAAGDLAVGTGADTAARLAKGAEGTFLRAGASTAAWATPAIADVSGLQTALDGKVLKAGDTMTGNLLLNGTSPKVEVNGPGARLVAEDAAGDTAVLAGGIQSYAVSGGGFTEVLPGTLQAGIDSESGAIHFISFQSGSPQTQKFAVHADGVMTFGAADDTNLYRAAANLLATDDAFRALVLEAAGMAGSTENVRLVGGTASGAPVTEAHVVGDIAVALDQRLYVCTGAGTPGTWAVLAEPTNATTVAAAGAVMDTGNETIGGVKTFSSDPLIPDEVYNATAWDGSLEPPTKNAVRDKFESIPPRRIFETALGVWTADAPSGRANYQNTIEFVGVTDPSDATNGINTPANIVAGDRWTETTGFVT